MGPWRTSSIGPHTNISCYQLDQLAAEESDQSTLNVTESSKQQILPNVPVEALSKETNMY